MANNTNVTLYTCSCDRKKIDKTAALQNTTEITDTFRIKEPCSILNPEIELAKSTVQSNGINIARLNYAYVERFKRYYFIDDIIFENDGLIRLKMSIDVLMSYANQILSSQQEVVRAESLNSRLYIDPERPLQSNKLLDVSDTQFIGNFPESIGENTNNYVMTVAGG